MKPKFTKKHYEELAVVLRNCMSVINNAPEPEEMQIGAGVVVTALANHFAKDNNRFDKSLFLKALTKETHDE